MIEPHALLAPLLLLLTGSGMAAQHVANGGLEEEPAGKGAIPSWSIVYDGVHPLAELDRGVAHSGKQSVRVSGRLPLDRMRLLQNFAGLRSGRWRFDLWYRTGPDFGGSRMRESVTGWLARTPRWQRATAGRPYLCVRFVCDTLVSVMQPLDLTGGEWRQAHCSFEIPAGTKRTQLMLGIRFCQGSVWFDDVTLRALRPDEPLEPTQPAPTRPVAHVGTGDWEAALRDALPGITQLRKGHPRLYFLPEDVARLRRQRDTALAVEHRLLKDWSNGFADRVPVTVKPGTFGNECHTAGAAVSHFVLLFLLTGEELYAEKAISWMMATVRFSSHGHDRYNDLMSSSIMHGLALGYDHLHDRMTTAERERVKSRLLFLAQAMFDSSGGYYWGHKYWYNHHHHQLSVMGVAALALLGDCPEASPILVHAVEEIGLAMRLHPADGCPHEGIGYFMSGMIPVSYFRAALKNVTGLDVWRDAGGISAFPRFLLYCTNPGLKGGFNFGDIGWRNYRGLLQHIAAHSRDGLTQFLGSRGEAKPFDMLLPRDPELPPRPPDDLPGFAHFRDLDIVVFRTGWSKDDLALYFKCGSFGGRALARYAPTCRYIAAQCGHEHADQTSFALAAFGEQLVTDFGYNATATAEHSAIIIDGKGQLHLQSGRWNTIFQHAGRIETAFHVPGVGYAVGSAPRAYPDDLQVKELQRRMLFLGERYFVVDDRMSSDLTHQWQWQLHSNADVSIDRTSARLTKPQASLAVHTILPEDARLSEGKGLVVRPPGTSAVERFLHVLFPLKPGDEAPRIERGATGSVSVEHNGRRDVYVPSPAAGGPGDVTVDGERGAVVDVDGQHAGAVLLEHGVRLTVRGRDLIRAALPATIALSHRPDGTRIHVESARAQGVSVHLAFTPARIDCRGRSIRFETSGGACRFEVPSGSSGLMVYGEAAP